MCSISHSGAGSGGGRAGGDSAVVPGESGEGDDGGESLTGVDTEDRKHSLHDG